MYNTRQNGIKFAKIFNNITLNKILFHIKT